MCREHLLQLQQTNWSKYAIEFLVISFEQPEFVRRYRDEIHCPWPMIADPDRQLYRLFQMQRATVRQIMNWKSLQGYLGLVFGRGRKVKLPTNHDYLQLGGDVLIDPQGRIQMHHLSHAPDDRPAILAVQSIMDRWLAASTGPPANRSETTQ